MPSKPIFLASLAILTSACTQAPAEGEEDTVELAVVQDFPAGEIQMSEHQVYEVTGGVWRSTFKEAALTAGIPAIHNQEKFLRVTPSCVLFQGITDYSSMEGPSPIAMASKNMAVVATWDGKGYGMTTLGEGLPFDKHGDALTVVATDDAGEEIRVRVEPPAPLGYVGNRLGEKDGLATEFSAEAGMDAMFSYGVDPSEEFGNSGAVCLYLADTLTVENGIASTPLFDEPTRDALALRGIEPEWLSIGTYNYELSEAFYGEGNPIPVMAGRMFSFAPDVLDPNRFDGAVPDFGQPGIEFPEG